MGADAGDLLATLANVREQLSQFDGEEFEANLGLESGQFEATFRGVQRRLAEFATATYSAALGADTGVLAADIANARRIGESFARERFEAAVGLDTTRLATEIADARRIGEGFARQTFSATLGVDDRTPDPIRDAKGRAEDLEQTYTMRLSADEGNARASIDALKVKAEELGATDVEISVDADTGRASAQIKVLDSQVDRLDGRDINIGVSASALGRLSELGAGFKELASGLRSAGILIRAARIPFLIAGLGAVPAIAGAATVAVGQLAIGLSQGIVGAAGVGGAAIGGFVAGLASYTAGISSVISSTREANDVLNENHKEQLAMARAQILNTRAGQRFNSALDGMILSLTRVQAEVGVRILPTFTRWINLLSSRLPQLTPPLFRLVEGVTEVADSFVRAISSGERFSNLQRVLGFIASSGIRAAQVAKNLGLALLAAIQPVLSPAANLQRTLVELSRSIRQWAESARGQRQIADFFQQAWQRAKQLFEIIKNVGQGFRNLASIIAPGVGDIMGGLVRLSRGFAQIGAKGTDSRQKILQFVHDSQPVLKALGNLVGTITREFFKLAGNVAKMRDGKKDIGTLAGAINGLSKAIPPVRRLLQQTFKDLGPTIGPLARQIARFFKEFAGSTDVLTRTVRLMTGLLRQFNKLPEPVKSAVAELVAFRIISRALGFGILLKLATSLGKAGAALLGFGKNAKEVQAANAVMRGSFLRLATTILTRFGPGGALYVFGEFAAHVIKNNDRIKASILGLADWINTTGAGKIIQSAQKLPQGVKDGFDTGLKNTPVFGALLDQSRRNGIEIARQWTRDGQKTGQNAREGFKKGLQGDTGMKAFAERTRADARAHFGIRSPSTVFAAIGRDLIAGLIAGVRQGMPNVGKVMQVLAKNIPDSVRKLLGISSPSKVMEGVGRDVGEGFARGIEDSQQRVQDAARKMMSGGFAEMTSGWRDTLRKIQTGKEFDIGGDLDKADAPRAIWNALRAAGWIVRGNQIFHPDTPPSALPTPSSGGTSRSRGQRTGSMSAQQFSNLPDAQRFALAARGGLPAPPRGYSWAEDYSLVRDSFFSGARRSGSPMGLPATDDRTDRRLRGGPQTTARHRAASAGEMRQIMREAMAAQGKNIYAAAAAAGLDPRALRLLWDLLDKTMGSDFAFRNGMGAAPN